MEISVNNSVILGRVTVKVLWSTPPFLSFSFFLFFSTERGWRVHPFHLQWLTLWLSLFVIIFFNFLFPDLKCLEQLPLTTKTFLKELHLIFPKRSGSTRSELNNHSVLLVSCSTGALAPPTAPSSSSGSSVLWTGMLSCSTAGWVCGTPSGLWLSSPCEGYRN